jgi:hypothetical protein
LTTISWCYSEELRNLIIEETQRQFVKQSKVDGVAHRNNEHSQSTDGGLAAQARAAELPP